MAMGSWGPFVFEVSDRKMLALRDITRTAGSTWSTHNTIEGKPKTQYQAPKLRTVSGAVTLRADYGVKPRAQLEDLAKASEKANVYPLIIGGKPLSQKPMRLTGVSETWNTVYNGGELFSAEVSLTFEEYV